MTLEELFAKHEGKIDKEVVEAIIAIFEAEKEISKKAHSKNNRENISLKSKLKGLETTLEKLGFDLEGDLEDQVEEKLNNSTVNKDNMSQLEKKIQSLTKKFEEKEAKELELTRKLNNKTVSQGLRKALKDGNVKVLDDLEDLIVDSYLNSNKAKVLEDGKVVFVNSDGDDVSLEEEVEAYKKKHPGRFSIDQKTGSGTTNNNNSKKKVNKISTSEFMAMGGAERATFAQENPDFVLTE